MSIHSVVVDVLYIQCTDEKYIISFILTLITKLISY